MRSSSSFSPFSRLPAELQIQIWKEASREPSIHTFDVCFPSRGAKGRARSAFTSFGGMVDEERYAIYETTVFFDATTLEPDLSVYKWKEKLRTTCWEANKAVQLQSSEPDRQLMHDVEHSDVNSVYLPGPDRWVTYDNRLDVIHLRLRADPMSGMESPGDIESGNINSAGEGSEPIPSRSPESMCGVSRLLDCLWSKEMATTVRLARHIAFDVSDVWDDSTAGPLFLEEAPFLAFTWVDNHWHISRDFNKNAVNLNETFTDRATRSWHEFRIQSAE
ncbi:uncharacterized protein E0L32_010801 [Thyridium curvatum]|uniref:2EXR domain-containing protein n=1 Tax=Thyridium curvatum TaxID=1093900 RepID=A0A507AM58_9PEZI|nr:uncharacterized protein E0L32_010801 [Thyridium curvatum]TPX07304.1 hypothetical protein E0L32_010801 [Thyridium curvatum]